MLLLLYYRSGLIPFSHSDTSIWRKSHLVAVFKAAVYPWECWSEFLVAGCPSSHQPTWIREETLESGGPLPRALNFRLRTTRRRNIKILIQNKINLLIYKS